MIKRATIYIDYDYLFVIVLLVLSGNPITHFFGKYPMIIISMAILAGRFNKIRNPFYIKFLLIAAGLLLIFILQNIVLGFVSWPGAINYIMMFLFAGLIVHLVSERFVFKFFIALYYISLISVVLFVFINLLNIHPPAFQTLPGRFTYGIYTYVREHNIRNCGMFWEPGAFAGVITLCLALNINELPFLWQHHKGKVLVMIMALLTTISTTGYIVLFIIGIFYVVFFIKSRVATFIFLPALFFIGVIIYENSDFLRGKIERQSQSTLDLDKSEYSNSRFGALLFDLHYIKKHPLIGNGFYETTRYADNPELIRLIQFGQTLAHGNGFSNYMATLGIPFMFVYLLISFKAIAAIDKKTAFLVIFVIILLQMGEQWLNYPLFVGMMFIDNGKKLLVE